MITLNYTRDGRHFSDFELESVVSELEDGQVLDFSSELFLHAVRAAVADGYLAVPVRVCHDGQHVDMLAPDGSLCWPKGFCNHLSRFLGRIARSRRLR